MFRTAFGQQFSMPKIANYLHDGMKVKTVAVVWVNNDFGKGGRDSFVKEMTRARHQGRGRYLHRAGPGRFRLRRHQAEELQGRCVFVYCNEEESARFLLEAKRQGLDARRCSARRRCSSQKVVELAGPAANGVRGHVGLSADAPVPAIQEFAAEVQPALQICAGP